MVGAIQYESGRDKATEARYPYKAADATCPKVGITSYKSVGNFLCGASVNGINSALAQQQVSIAIQADQSSFRSYTSGIFLCGCGIQLEHGVLAAG